MTDENKVTPTAPVMPANNTRPISSLQRRGKPTDLHIPHSSSVSEFDFSPVSPFSESSLSPCLSTCSLNHDERPSTTPSTPEHTYLTPSLSMSSLQHDDHHRRRRLTSRHNHSHHNSLTPSFSMSSLTQSSARPRSLMESILIAKMEKATIGGSMSILNGYVSPETKSLMRTDSLGSTSSFTSTSSLGSDYCRCDDCLLGIADLSVDSTQQIRRKKVSLVSC